MLVALQLVGVADVPLKLNVLVPWLAPKFVPVIVTDTPTAPVVGERLVMLGAGTTVKFTPLLATPLVFTTTFPVVAPVGTGTTMLVALQVFGVPAVPLKATVPVPCVAPKPVPVIVIHAPTAPGAGERLVMLGVGRTVKPTPLLLTPLACTTTLPVVAPDGTGTTMLVALQLVGVDAVPLKLTVPLPWVEPKLEPVIVTEAPTAPEVGERAEILGAGTTVKVTPLLSTPLACTITLPVVQLDAGATMVVALQLVGVDAEPLKLTVPLPWVEPKLEPAIVTEAPKAPDVGERLLILGAGTTVKFTPLLTWLDTVTTTFPVVAPVGTGSTMLVGLQLVGVPAVPLNLTVLRPWVDPNVVPVIVTDAPTAPEVRDRLVI